MLMFNPSPVIIVPLSKVFNLGLHQQDCCNLCTVGPFVCKVTRSADRCYNFQVCVVKCVYKSAYSLLHKLNRSIVSCLTNGNNIKPLSTQPTQQKNEMLEKHEQADKMRRREATTSYMCIVEVGTALPRYEKLVIMMLKLTFVQSSRVKESMPISAHYSSIKI